MKSTISIVALAISTFVAFNAQAIDVTPKAKKLAQETIILDSHIDVPYRVHKKWVDVTKATKGGDFDHPRAVAGGLNAPFMSIYIPATYEGEGKDFGVQLAHQLIDSVEAIAQRAPDKFAVAYSTADVYSQFEQGKISLPMGMENGSPIANSFENLAMFHERGIRYVTLSHSLSNHISDSSYDLRRQWKGLSEFGKTLIPEMNRIGMMIDISHVSDAAFYQALELTQTPVIASHSSLRKFTPGFERNMDDEMIKALAKNGGVIQINFGSSFVSAAPQEWQNKLKAKLEKENAKWGEEKAERIAKLYKENNPYPFASLDTVLDHIDHVKNLVGVDYIGIGSDYDGVGDSLPRDLKDVSYFPQLVQGLMNRGYSDADIKKILSGNFMRVWKQVEQFAAKSK
ncbi:dipeptidase [Psychrosphaera aquimarina]|uniref:Dipeptidase n=1 Tax=Psychrosphaera aquimarina TaxID=2044854 RepID=A0ABU3QZU1_9GAMM|nr:dipeptidase [Psychrosphaera aquimarina]MDU0112945.1 dipeptidase [Psychrosphaera aquimarina]